jgi:hypothetical protein
MGSSLSLVFIFLPVVSLIRTGTHIDAGYILIGDLFGNVKLIFYVILIGLNLQLS